MLDQIRNIFSKPKPGISNEAQQFFIKFAASDVWILAVGMRGAPEIPNASDPSAFEIIASHRIDVTELGENDSVFPFNYERNGQQCLPFFSTEEMARDFIDSLGKGLDPAIFQPFLMRVGFVATPENENFQLVLDPGSACERDISMGERHFIREISNPEG